MTSGRTPNRSQLHTGTAHILNTASPQPSTKEEKSELLQTRLAGGTGASRTMAERNLVFASYRSLGAPKNQPPWTREEMRQYLAEAAANGGSIDQKNHSFNTTIDQKIQRLENEVASLNTSTPSSSASPSSSSSSSAFSSSSSSSPSSSSSSSSSSSTVDEGSHNHFNYSYSRQQRHAEKHGQVQKGQLMTPHDHVDAIKHHLHQRIETRNGHIARSAAAECSFVESLPAARSVQHHPEYQRLARKAYRFELDAQMRAQKARGEVERLRAEKIAKRSQEHQHQMSMDRETDERRKREQRKMIQVTSLDRQMATRRKLQEKASQKKIIENRDLKYLRDSLEEGTTQREKLLEAHHESEQVLHLLKWQKMHREELRNRTSRKAAAGAAAASKKKKTRSRRR